MPQILHHKIESVFMPIQRNMTIPNSRSTIPKTIIIQFRHPPIIIQVDVTSRLRYVFEGMLLLRMRVQLYVLLVSG